MVATRRIATRLYIVPVAVNYDRVLEDRSLLRELAAGGGAAAADAWSQLGEVATIRRLERAPTWSRGNGSGTAAPRSSSGSRSRSQPWFAANRDCSALSQPDRLTRVQALCDDVMERVGALIPVTSVPLVCAAIQSFDAEFVARDRLLDRVDEMRGVLVELNAGVVRQDRTAAEMFDRAYRMLRMRKVIARTGTGTLVLPSGRPLVSYYANSVAHLLGDFAQAVRARDALPALAGIPVNR